MEPVLTENTSQSPISIGSTDLQSNLAGTLSQSKESSIGSTFAASKTDNQFNQSTATSHTTTVGNWNGSTTTEKINTPMANASASASSSVTAGTGANTQTETSTDHSNGIMHGNEIGNINDWPIWLPVFFGSFGISIALIGSSALLCGVYQMLNGKLYKVPKYVSHV